MQRIYGVNMGDMQAAEMPPTTIVLTTNIILSKIAAASCHSFTLEDLQSSVFTDSRDPIPI